VSRNSVSHIDYEVKAEIENHVGRKGTLFPEEKNIERDENSNEDEIGSYLKNDQALERWVGFEICM
jgi:hypothetical protein